MTDFVIRRLSNDDDRSQFISGSDALDHYFHQCASQDVRRLVSQCFIATLNSEIVGYYTLAATAVSVDRLPSAVTRRLPRYPTIPAVLIGRLAVAQHQRGQGIGGDLLADVRSRALASDIACHSIIVDAIDEAANRFYQHHGFIPFEDNANRLYLALKRTS